MARFISGSVGVGGVNLKEDVRVIQEMLNRVPPGSSGPSPLLDTDGLVGPITIGAIRKFQQANLGFQDGRVDVNNKTIAKLNSFDTTPAATATVRFAHENPQDSLNPRNPTDALDGLDTRAVPFPWLLAPNLGSNRIRLVNGGSFSLLTANRNVATVEREVVVGTLGRLFTGLIIIRGVSVGDTFIRILDGIGNQVARLDVSVRRKRRMTVAFHYVKQPNIFSATNPGIQTSRNPGGEAAVVDQMNRIYLRQTNIEFSFVSARPLNINENLGIEVNTSLARLDGEWPRIVRHRSASAKFNVFFVRELETDLDGEPGNAAFSTSPTDTFDAITEIGGNRDCIFEDAAGNPLNLAETLSHEAGHALGELDDANSNLLMFGTTDARGRKINKAQALRMNANAAI